MQQIKCFFPLFMLVFLLGLLIHLIIPIQIVTNNTLKIEKSYNNYKLMLEQELVRSMTTLNSYILGNKIQLSAYPTRSIFKMFKLGNQYENVNPSFININSAYELANMNTQQLSKVNLDLSMWYMPNVSKFQDMSPKQKQIFERIICIQPFIDGYKLNSNMYLGLEAVELIVKDEQVQIYVSFPSSKNEQFQKFGNNILDDYYEMSFQSLILENRTQSIFHKQNKSRVCYPFLRMSQPFAMMCLVTDIVLASETLALSMTIPNFQLSSNDHYIINPLFQRENQTYPKIVSNFTTENITNIQQNFQLYFQDFGPILSKKLFSSDYSSDLYVAMKSPTKTYYVIPILYLNNLERYEVSFIMTTINKFEKSQLNSKSRYLEFLVIMIVPSIILFVFFSVLMAIIMRRNFNKIERNAKKMGDYCQFMKKNDFDLQISETEIESDFGEIFNQLQNLNILNKLVTPTYFKVPVHQRIIKLLGILEIFSKLGYEKDKVYFHLYECYREKSESQNSLKFLQLSIDCLQQKLKCIEDMKVKQLDEQNIAVAKKCLLRKQQLVIKNLQFQLFCSVRILYELHNPGDKSVTSQIKNNVAFLQKLSQRSFKIENIFCLILETICQLDDDTSLSFISRKVSNLQKMMNKLIENRYKSWSHFPQQVLRSYWYFLNGKMCFKKQNYLESYEFFVLSLDGKQYDPRLHQKIKQQIENIIKIYSIYSVNLKQMFSSLIQKKREREFIFVYDTSNPNMSREDFGEWKREVRSMTCYIFDEFVHSEDRIGINEFCQDFKVVCNLIQKGGSEKLLKKQLWSTVKAKQSPIYSEVLENIGKVIERTYLLKNEKVFLFFLKEGKSIGSQEVLEVISKCPNSKFLFFLKNNNKRILNCGQSYFVLDLHDKEGVQLIIRNKRIEATTHNIHLF